MWRIMTASLVAIAEIAVAGVAIAAPGPKDPAKKDSPIVGEWQLLSVDGQDTISATYNFSATGDLDARGFIGNVESGFRARYVTNEKPDPFEIDITHHDDRYEGIFKFEADRLTICYRLGRGQRPKKFDEKGATQEVFERVKKKD